MDVPAFPLQLLLRRRADWAGLPTVVVERDEPQGRVLWANEEARRRRVLPGHRYAAALALAKDLRADVVPEEEIRRGVLETAARLRRFTPTVDPSREEPGVFRLDAGGLARLHPDLRAWAQAVRADLAAAGLRASVVVGATEFGAYAVARALGRGDALPVLDADAERRALRRVPLDRLDLDPGTRDLLAKLGVRTVADFLALPAEGLRGRFGEAVHRLHRLASGEARDPLRPEPDPEPVRASAVLEHPVADGARLLFVVKRLLDPLLATTAERREALAGIELRLHLDDGGERTDVLRPAAPTLDAAQILDLLRLRLEAMPAAPSRLVGDASRERTTSGSPARTGDGWGASRIDEVTLVAQAVPATAEQLALFAEKPKRDLAAADRALARIRAELGEDSVVRAQLRDAHLPEASFTWERLDRTRLPRVRAVSRAPLVRRLLARPLPLPPRSRHEPDGWMLHGFEHGNVVRLDGPYVVAGGWWGGGEVRREYHFAETSKGRLLWVFHDVRRRRWFLQGEVS